MLMNEASVKGVVYKNQVKVTGYQNEIFSALENDRLAEDL